MKNPHKRNKRQKILKKMTKAMKTVRNQVKVKAFHHNHNHKKVVKINQIVNKANHHHKNYHLQLTSRN